MLSIQGLLSLCSVIYRDSNKTKLLFGVVYMSKERNTSYRHTNRKIMLRNNSGLIKCRIVIVSDRFKTTIKTVKKAQYLKRNFYSEPRNTIKKHITNTPKTLRGSTFKWSINHYHNSCDTEPWQHVSKMPRLFSNTKSNNTSHPKQILLQNYIWRAKPSANFRTRSKHQ